MEKSFRVSKEALEEVFHSLTRDRDRGQSPLSQASSSTLYLLSQRARKPHQPWIEWQQNIRLILYLLSPLSSKSSLNTQPIFSLGVGKLFCQELGWHEKNNHHQKLCFLLLLFGDKQLRIRTVMADLKVVPSLDNWPLLKDLPLTSVPQEKEGG